MSEPLRTRREQPASVPRTATAPRLQSERRATSTPPPISGLAFGTEPGQRVAVVRRQFRFQGKGFFSSEMVNFADDVNDAIEKSKEFANSIADVKEKINALGIDTIREAALAELAKIEEFVNTWDEKTVPLAQRDEVVRKVNEVTNRLAAMPADFAKQDAAEADRRARVREARAEERKQKKAANEQEALERQRQERAERERNAAEEKKRWNRTTLQDRGVVKIADDVADKHARAETQDEENALKADHDKPRRGASKGEKAAAEQRYTEGMADLEKRRAESRERSIGGLANFASSAAGRALSEENLTWVIETAGVDLARAKCLASVIKEAAGDRTVARGLAKLDSDEVAAITPHCITLMKKGVTTAWVIRGGKAMATSADVVAYVEAASATRIPGYLGLADIVAPGKLKDALAYAEPNATTAYTPALARRLLVALATKGAEPAAVHWLTDRKDNAEFAGLAELYIDAGVDLDELRSVFRAAKGIYSDAETVGLCQRHKANLEVITTYVEKGQPGCPGYIDLIMTARANNVVRFGEAHQLAALRAVALLSAGSDKVSLTIGGQPSDYGRAAENEYGQPNRHQRWNTDNDAKTGFVTLTFSDPAARFEIHTHWAHGEEEDGRIYSMHVVIGGNGAEFNTDQIYRPLIDKVVQLHKDHYPEPEGGEFNA